VTKRPTRCVVDTNVATTANQANQAASMSCVAASARALQSVMISGHVFIDDGGRIVAEYRARLSARGQPGPGDAFLKWLLTHEWGGQRVTRVPLTARGEDPDDFHELPSPPKGVRYDASDRKFLAVAAAHEERPPILQSFDSKWWGWRAALEKSGVSIHFLCKEEIAEKHRQKMGP
jgi:hypothetical protein